MARIIETVDAPFSNDTPYVLELGDTFFGEIEASEATSMIFPERETSGGSVIPAVNAKADVVAVALAEGQYEMHFAGSDANAGTLGPFLLSRTTDVGVALGALVRITGTDIDGYSATFSVNGGTYFFIIGAGNDNAAGTYQFSVTEAVVRPNFAREGEFLPGSNDGELIEGTIGDDRISALGGDDTLDGGSSSDSLTGGAGEDTASIFGNRADYTLELLADGTQRIFDRTDDFDVDTLASIETVDFLLGDDLDLQAIRGILNNSEEDLDLLIEMYIAYFNRAPDALGLYFWGTAFANGVSIEEIAALFLDQDETRATYPASDTNLEFATQVYSNVLGRTPDSAGLTFWQEQLDSGAVGRDTFILEVLRGAKADAPDGASAEFVELQAGDRAYLETKTDIGTYYAAIRGMSDVDNASEAMALFNRGDASSIATAQDRIDQDYADLLAADDGGLLLPLVGVVDDPFAA